MILTLRKVVDRIGIGVGRNLEHELVGARATGQYVIIAGRKDNVLAGSPAKVTSPVSLPWLKMKLTVSVAPELSVTVNLTELVCRLIRQRTGIVTMPLLSVVLTSEIAPARPRTA